MFINNLAHKPWLHLLYCTVLMKTICLGFFISDTDILYTRTVQF